MDTVICPKCGTKNPVDAVNCTECGTNLAWAVDNPEEINAIKPSQQDQERIQESTSYFEENIIFGFNQEGLSRIFDELRQNILRLIVLLLIIGVLGAFINYEKSFFNPFGVAFPIFCIITGGILFGVMAVITVAETIFYFLFF